MADALLDDETQPLLQQQAAYGMPGDPEMQRRLGLSVGLPAFGAHFGAALLAASQRGITPEQRAHYLAQAAQAPQAMMAATASAQTAERQAVAQKFQQQYQGLQSRNLESQIADRERSNAEWGMPGAAPIGARPAVPATPGAPAAPGSITGAAAGAPGQFSPGGLQLLIGAESSGNPNARPIDPATGRPLSSAGGPGQFIDPTWLRFANANREHFEGLNRQQILDARFGPRGAELAPIAIQWLAGENAGHLRQAGLPVNDATLAIMHQFGEAGGVRLLRAYQADPNAPVATAVGGDALTANRRQLEGRTVGQVVGTFVQRHAAQPPAAAPGAAAPGTGAAPDPTLSRGVQRAMAMGATRAQAEAIAVLPSDQRNQAMAALSTRAPVQPHNIQIIDGPDGSKLQVMPDGSTRPITPGDTTQRTATSEDGLRTQFLARPAVVRYEQSRPLFEAVTQSTDRVRGALAGGQHDQLAELDAVIGIANLFDPGSVVRDNEVTNVIRTQGLPGWLQQQLGHVTGGQRMTTAMLDQIEGAAADRMTSYRRTVDADIATYRGLAGRRNLNAENVIPDFGDPVAERNERRRARDEAASRPPDATPAELVRQMRALIPDAAARRRAAQRMPAGPTRDAVLQLLEQ
jgi:hypothetical protein